MAEAPSVRESLSASISALESSGGGSQDTGGGTATAAPSPDSPAGGDAAAPAGGSLYESPPTQPTAPEAPRAGELPPADRQQAPQLGGQQPVPKAPKAPAAGEAPPPQLRAPAAWKAEVREKWAGLPPEVQQEVLRRERTIARALDESAEARRNVEHFNEICAPYRQLIAMEGGNPLVAFGDYLKTAAILRVGTPAQKAQSLAYLVNMFGVDVRLLDSSLAQIIGSGATPLMPLQGQQPQQPQQPQPGMQQEFRDPRVDQFLAERQQEFQAEAAEDVENFYSDARNEFINDVRYDMADILELAANRGRKMSLAEAYNSACMMHPEIAKVMQQRQLASTAQRQNGQFAAKQRAAGSVTPAAGASSSPNGKPLSVREAIEQSIAQLSG